MKIPLHCVYPLLAISSLALAQPPAGNPFVDPTEPPGTSGAEHSISGRDKPGAQLDRAYVTIPYSELRALWEAGQAKAAPQEAPAPVSFVMNSADCELQLGERSSALKAQFDLEVLENKWQPIPLIGGAE